MKKYHSGKILNNERIAKDTNRMDFETGIEEILPGQFVSILCENKMLRRPFSVMNFEVGKISVMYKIKGEGTEYLSKLKTGDTIDYLAPLGNNFNYKNKNSCLLIGAGIGIAPMLFLKKQLNKEGIKNFLITGFKSDYEVIKGSDKTVIGGSVTDNISELIETINPDAIFSCGPMIVLKLVSEIAKSYNINVQVAMEKVMACGIGVCRGCIINLKDGSNASICKDGPVFNGEDIEWQLI